MVGSCGRSEAEEGLTPLHGLSAFETPSMIQNPIRSGRQVELMSSDRDGALDVFFSYSHRDESLRDELEKHLALLEREGTIRTWHDRRIGAVEEWKGELDRHLEPADLILLLISPDFIASDYCFDVEMKRALERHEAGEARVIPVNLRPSDWETTRFADLQALPRDGKPVTSWTDQDAAFVDVAKGIRALLAPLYPDDETRELSETLELAYQRKAELAGQGQDTTQVTSEILELRRSLREGAQLKAGDFLADGRFKLLEPIGQGGFARVWKAYDGDRRSLAAIKVLHGQYAADRSRRDRFFRGARLMARLRHENVVHVVDEKCEDGGFYFFAMKYVGALSRRGRAVWHPGSGGECLGVVPGRVQEGRLQGT